MPASRRHFLARAGMGLLAIPQSMAGAIPEEPPPSKLSVATAFDREMQPFMADRQVPGGALAVVKDHRLVYARGYGWADREKQVAARPDSLFRIASLSKPITAVAILKLVEKRKLSLDDRPFGLIKIPAFVAQGSHPDDRLKQITIRHLLHHSGGWDRDQSFDPMFRSRQIAHALGVPSPPGPKDVIRYLLGQPLDFDPGTRYAYSNYGYCVLGRVIEHLTRLPYEKFVQQNLLAPIGIRKMRIGASLEPRAAPGEVRYYTANHSTTRSVFNEEPTPWPYGGFCLETMDAHGGWIASAVDLARFAAALADPQRCPWLQPRTLQTMHERPPAPLGRDAEGRPARSYYGCGWQIRPVRAEGKANYWHNGSLPGTFTLLVRRWDGLSWAALFNQRSENKELPDHALDAALHRAANAVGEWPKGNLFGRF